MIVAAVAADGLPVDVDVVVDVVVEDDVDDEGDSLLLHLLSLNLCANETKSTT